MEIGEQSARRPASQAETGDEASRGPIRIWLLDEIGVRMPGAPYRLLVGSETWEGHADGDGLAVVENVPEAHQGMIEWGQREDPAGGPAATGSGAGGASDAFEGVRWVPRQGDLASPQEEEEAPTGSEYMYTKWVYLNTDSEGSEGTRRRLFNLGFVGSDEDQRTAFSSCYGDLDLGDVHAQGTEWGREWSS